MSEESDTPEAVVVCDGSWNAFGPPDCGDPWHGDPERHEKPDLIAERHWQPPAEDTVGYWTRKPHRWHVCNQWCKKVLVIEKEE